MSGTSLKIMVDANVWVDSFCADHVRNMTENATAVGADASDLWLADKYLALHRDYEDNLVLAACKRAQVDYLVTNDRKLLEHADIAAKTPRQMMPILALAERGGRVSR